METLTQEQLNSMTEAEVAEYMSRLLELDRKLAANHPSKSMRRCESCGRWVHPTKKCQCGN